MPRSSLAIIGMGAFGRFMLTHLAPHFDIVTADHAAAPRGAIDSLASTHGARVVAVEDAAGASVIVLAVPVQALPAVLTQIAPSITPSSLVLDVCSVKLEPIALMQRLLPPSVESVGLHPLFGPQSGKDGIAGLPIALCPSRAAPATLEAVEQFLCSTLQLHVIRTSAEDHDRQMAYVQGLTHFLSRALGTMDLPQTPMATRAYERFLAMKADLHADSLDLFLTIERHNPFARGVRSQLLSALEALERQIGPGPLPPS